MSGAPDFSDAMATCAETSLAYSGRSTDLKTPNGVGELSSWLRRASAKASDGQ